MSILTSLKLKTDFIIGNSARSPNRTAAGSSNICRDELLKEHVMTTRTKKRSRLAKRRGAKYWVVAIGTMGILVAFSPRNSHAITIRKAIVDSETSMSGQRPIKFNIPADTLEIVLIVFQKTS